MVVLFILAQKFLLSFNLFEISSNYNSSFQWVVEVLVLEEGMTTHSSILAWRIPWTEEPGGLPWGHTELDMIEATKHASTQECWLDTMPSSHWV